MDYGSIRLLNAVKFQVMAKSPLTPRRCIFCGSRKNITREHVVPNWLRKVVPRLRETHVHSGLRTTSQGRTLFVQPLWTVKDGNLGNKKLFMVCADCNGGWMRNLQDELKPILIPLIEGEWQDLNAESAGRISAWMAMTATVIALSIRDTLGVTRAERKFIYENHHAPDNWSIWIGRGSGFDDICYSNRVGFVAEVSEGQIESFELGTNEANTNVTTIALGKLILHSASVPILDISPNPTQYGEMLGVVPLQPWTGDAVDWRYIPIIRSGSPEYILLCDAFTHEVIGYGSTIRELN